MPFHALTANLCCDILHDSLGFSSSLVGHLEQLNFAHCQGPANDVSSFHMLFWAALVLHAKQRGVMQAEKDAEDHQHTAGDSGFLSEHPEARACKTFAAGKSNAEVPTELP